MLHRFACYRYGNRGYSENVVPHWDEESASDSISVLISADLGSNGDVLNSEIHLFLCICFRLHPSHDISKQGEGRRRLRYTASTIRITRILLIDNTELRNLLLRIGEPQDGY